MKDPLAPGDPDRSKVEEWFERHPFIERLFHWFMLGLTYGIVFCIGGALLFLGLAGKSSGGSKDLALKMTPLGAWVCFGVGGLGAVGWLVWIFRRKSRRPTI